MQERIAIPVHNSRVSPVFDVARRVVLVDTSDGEEDGRSEWDIDLAWPCRRAAWLLHKGVDVLICAAISAPLAGMVRSQGTRLYASVVGEIDDVIGAYLSGNLQKPRYMMPGCCGRRRRLQRGRNV
ncbi:MAG: hypothetical protein GXP25_03640 [Planctomycetes bacterium]|nr:hypothetical protein [Planctomycetota bacterium]